MHSITCATCHGNRQVNEMVMYDGENEKKKPNARSRPSNAYAYRSKHSPEATNTQNNFPLFDGRGIGNRPARDEIANTTYKIDEGETREGASCELGTGTLIANGVFADRCTSVSKQTEMREKKEEDVCAFKACPFP